MNKQEIAKAQGKCFTKSTHGRTLAVALDTASLYTERSAWGKPVRFHKTFHTAVKQDRLGCMEDGWLVLHVSDIGWDVNYAERIALAEMFIRDFNGTTEDVLNADGSVNHDKLQADVTVSLFNNRNLLPRPEPVATSVIIADGVRMTQEHENGRPVIVLDVVPVLTHPWLRADNAAKAYAKSVNNGFKLVRLSSQGSVFVYGWQAV